MLATRQRQQNDRDYVLPVIINDLPKRFLIFCSSFLYKAYAPHNEAPCYYYLLFYLQLCMAPNTIQTSIGFMVWLYGTSYHRTAETRAAPLGELLTTFTCLKIG